MRYTAATVHYFEVIDNETGLTVEKYNTEAEAEAVADILNRSEPTSETPNGFDADKAKEATLLYAESVANSIPE